MSLAKYSIVVIICIILLTRDGTRVVAVVARVCSSLERAALFTRIVSLLT